MKGTKREAQKELIKQLNLINEGSYIDATKMSVGEYLETWLKDSAKDNVGNQTYVFYKNMIDTHLIPALGEHRLKDLSPHMIDQYYSKALNQGRRDGKGGLSKRSVHHHHRLLFTALQKAVRWRMISVNPVAAAEPPKPGSAEISFLEKDKIPALLKTAKGSDLFPIVFLALNTGMRRGELLGLRWSDVGLDQGFLNVRQSLQYTKENGLQFTSPKTKSGKRKITLASIAVEALREHKAKQLRDRLMLGLGKDSKALVFSYPNGEPLAPYNITRKFGRLVEKSDIQAITFHGLRHTHITHLLADGVDIKTVSQRAGHASASITLDVYAHALEDAQDRAAQMIDVVMRAALEE